MRIALKTSQLGRPGRWIMFWLLAELLLFLALAQWFGFGFVIVAQVASTLIGIALFRRLGRGALGSRSRAPAGKESAIADALGASLTALLFTLPGFLTTLAGLLLTMPFFRRRFLQKIQRWFAQTFPQSRFGNRTVELNEDEWRVAPQTPPSLSPAHHVGDTT